MYRFIFFFLMIIFLGLGVTVNAQSEEIEIDREAQFLIFLEFFEEVDLPFELSLEQIKEFYPLSKIGKYEVKTRQNPSFTKIAEHFVPMRPRIKCTVRPDITAVARFLFDKNTVGVIYEAVPIWSRKTATHSFYLCYYDLKGNLLKMPSENKTPVFCKKIGFAYNYQCQAFTISNQGKIEMKRYQNQWETKPEIIPIEKNNLLGFEEKEFITWQLAGLKGVEVLK